MFISRKFNSKRDWGHAKEFVFAQWKILQHKIPDDFVIALEKLFSKNLVDLVLKKLGIKYSWKKDKGSSICNSSK